MSNHSSSFFWLVGWLVGCEANRRSVPAAYNKNNKRRRRTPRRRSSRRSRRRRRRWRRRRRKRREMIMINKPRIPKSSVWRPTMNGIIQKGSDPDLLARKSIIIKDAYVDDFSASPPPPPPPCVVHHHNPLLLFSFLFSSPLFSPLLFSSLLFSSLLFSSLLFSWFWFHSVGTRSSYAANSQLLLKRSSEFWRPSCSVLCGTSWIGPTIHSTTPEGPTGHVSSNWHWNKSIRIERGRPLNVTGRWRC